MTPPFFGFPQKSLAQMTPNVMKNPEMQKKILPKNDPPLFFPQKFSKTIGDQFICDPPCLRNLGMI